MQYWEIPLVIGVGAFLGMISFKAKLLTNSGIAASLILGLLIWLISGLKHLILILGFFCLGSAATRFRAQSKRNLEHYQERRTYANVLGSGLGPLIFCMLSKLDHSFRLGYVVTLASATGDTLATEIGELSKDRPRLITNFRKVPAGTHGGITPLGELFGLTGSLVISILGAGLGLMPLGMVPWAVSMGFLGVHLDSLLGATLERRKLLNGPGVNLSSCSVAGFLAGIPSKLGS